MSLHPREPFDVEPGDQRPARGDLDEDTRDALTRRYRRGAADGVPDPWDENPAHAPAGACCPAGACVAPHPCPAHGRPQEDAS